ncbi:MAG: serine/threonine protein kinase [Opitutales bacterium]|nr:serine/threonine protein kinase [Opitutales bacterium]
MPSEDETILNQPQDGAENRARLGKGDRIGTYQIEGHLGSGAMGDVYLATQVFLRQKCALKLLPTYLASDKDFEQRFANEGQALAMLDHPHIVRVLYAGVDAGRHYLSMEYVGGGDLETRLSASGGKLTPQEVLSILRQMLSALGYAHSKGVVHRDLKPANILQDARGNCKVGDFGLAMVAGEQFMQDMIRRSIVANLPEHGGDSTIVTSGLTSRQSGASASALVGTIDYISPELRAGKTADARSDIYALGVMAYLMLTGRKPLGMAKPPSKLARGLNPDWDAWVARCMEFDPDERFQSAEEAAKDLPRLEQARFTPPATATAPYRPKPRVEPNIRHSVRPQSSKVQNINEYEKPGSFDREEKERQARPIKLENVYTGLVTCAALAKLVSLFFTGFHELGSLIFFLFVAFLNYFVLSVAQASVRAAKSSIKTPGCLPILSSFFYASFAILVGSLFVSTCIFMAGLLVRGMN